MENCSVATEPLDCSLVGWSGGLWEELSLELREEPQVLTWLVARRGPLRELVGVPMARSVSEWEVLVTGIRMLLARIVRKLVALSFLTGRKMEFRKCCHTFGLEN